jgi:hypothetical protein
MTILKFLDISSAHLSDSDIPLLDDADLPFDSMSYAYGYIVSTASLIETSTRDEKVRELRKYGLSDSFIAAALKAADNACWLLRFTEEADIDDDLEVGRFIDHPDEDDRT